MSDDVFIDAILAAPDDDAPRLVYADALTERGDPRGEFITVQCERARLERAGLRGTRAHHDVAERERQLSLAHVKSWVDPIGLTRWFGQFERGFITHLSIKPNGLRTRWNVFARQPLESIRLRFQPREGAIADLAWVAARATLPKTIAIECYDGSAVFDAALLRAVLLAGGDDDDSMHPWPHRDFVDARLRPAIVKLTLSHPSANDLREACALPRLCELDCSNMTALEHADLHLPALPQLTRLWVSYIRADEATTLLGRDPPPNLRDFGLQNVHRAQFPDSVAKALVQSRFLPQVDALSADLALDESSARALGDRATALTKLSLQRFPIEDRALDALVGSGLSQRLRSLWIAGRDFPGPDALLRAGFEALRELTLDRFSIDTRVAPEMVAALPTVNSLDVRGSKLVVGVPEILRARWPSARIEEAPA